MGCASFYDRRRTVMEKLLLKTKPVLYVLFVLLTIFCCGCGNGVETVLGRYVETEVVLPDNRNPFVSMAQEQQELRLADLHGKDVISVDGGNHFENIDSSYVANEENVFGVTVAADGSRIVEDYSGGFQNWKLITAKGEVIILEDLDSDDYPYFCYGAGSFYMSKGCAVYRVDPVDGELQFLTESSVAPLYLSADDKHLFIVHMDGVILYDLQKGMIAAKQDEALSTFLKGKIDVSMDKTSSVLLYSYKEKIYILTKNGLYLHELYGGEMDCIVDGGLCSISDVDINFAGLAVTEEDGQNVFFVLYADGRLMRYTKDESLSAEPEEYLRIYSLYEDGNIRQAVSAFRKNYPEIGVRYEIGINPDYGVTKEDALKNLSTELATGTGPDILIMDDIPIKTYIEKGVLKELTPVREQMTEENYFLSVIDGLATDKGLYVMPLTFAIPVLAGDQEEIERLGEIESLLEFAEILEETTGENENSIIGLQSAEGVLKLFAQSSMGGWVTDDSLNRDEVEEFLTQVKMIYDIQMSNLSEDAQEHTTSGMDWGSGENVLIRKYGAYGLSDSLVVKLSLHPQQLFCAGYLSSALGDYPLTQGILDSVGYHYMLMPGQNYGNCLPTTLMAMNSVSKQEEECYLFLEYIYSSEFQGNVSLNGIPVNRQAYLESQKNPKERINGEYMAFGYSAPDGTINIMEIYWPSKEKFSELTYLIEDVSGVNYCDVQVYEAVIKYGQKALTGEMNIKEAVDTIEEELELYLAE